MKITQNIYASIILLVISSTQVYSSEQELMRVTYLKIFSVIEFVETNRRIEEACTLNQQAKNIGVFSAWEKDNADNLKSIMHIKSLYENKAIQVAGERARTAFYNQKNAILSKVTRTTAPFYTGAHAQVNSACQTWNMAMSNNNSTYLRKVASEITAIVNTQVEVIAAINNEKNW